MSEIAAAPDPTKAKKYGIAIIANDRVIEWLLPFFESYAEKSPSIPLYVIPYDDNISRTRSVAAAYGAEVVSVESSELDALTRRLYPFNPTHRRRVRKLLALVLPLDEVIYIDIDTVILQDFSPLLGHVQSGETDFVVSTRCFDYIFNSRYKGYDFLRDALLFSDGFFITSRHVLSLKDFYDVVSKDERAFHDVRHRGGVFSQPLTNFVVHRRQLRVSTLPDIAPSASGESYYKAAGLSMTPDGPVDLHGDKLYFCHWPGIIGTPRHRREVDIMWHQFAQKAASRVKI
jgi:hypothetical protein